MPNPVQRLIAAVNREFERRVTRASQPAEDMAHAPAAEEWDDSEVAIANVPRGTAVSGNTKEPGN